MAFWGPIRNSRFELMSSQLKRWSFQIHRLSPVRHIAGGASNRALANPKSFIPGKRIELYDSVRFFAAPVQVKPKGEEKHTSGPRLNEQIKAEFIRLVTDEGHGIVSRHEALQRAWKLNLDLVEVSSNAKPPVCKLMDFHREKYKKEIKEKEHAKSKSEVTLRKGDCKEVRFSGKCEQKDLKMKADTVKRLMDRGHRVKVLHGLTYNKPFCEKSEHKPEPLQVQCIAMGSKEQEDLGALLSRLTSMIEDVSTVESGPFVEKRQAYMIVRHVKFGRTKKGTGQKIPKAVEATSSDVQKHTGSPSTIKCSNPRQSPLGLKEDWRPIESALEAEDEIPPNEADTLVATSVDVPDGVPGADKMVWSAVDASNGEEVLCFDDDEDRIASGSTTEKMGNVSEAVLPLGVVDSIDSLHSKPLVASTQARATEPSSGSENRYTRNKQGNNWLPPIKKTESRYAERNLSAELPKFSESIQGRRPQFLKRSQPQSAANVLTLTEEHKRLETNASLSRNFKHRLPAENQKLEECQSVTATSSAPSYGIFSALKPAPNDTLSRK